MLKRDIIESEHFYGLMQDYRHAQLAEQGQAKRSYEKVKQYINIKILNWLFLGFIMGILFNFILGSLCFFLFRGLS